jgi:hypothetical protein
LWRLARLVHQHLIAALLDAPTLTTLLGRLAGLRRALAEPPRRRPAQLAAVPLLLS